MNPYQSFSCHGSHRKSTSYKPTFQQKMELSKWQKLIFAAITEKPEITLQQMATKYFEQGIVPSWSESTVSAYIKKTIQGLISNGELKPNGDGSYSLLKSEFLRPEKKLSIKGGLRK
jgi:N-acetylglucosamine-6-phosphate deacetylase